MLTTLQLSHYNSHNSPNYTSLFLLFLKAHFMMTVRSSSQTSCMPNAAANLLPLKNKEEHITLIHNCICFTMLILKNFKKRERKKIILFSKILPRLCPACLRFCSFLPPLVLYDWNETEFKIKVMFVRLYHSNEIILLLRKSFWLK